jgi:hypothetical protein
MARALACSEALSVLGVLGVLDVLERLTFPV